MKNVSRLSVPILLLFVASQPALSQEADVTLHDRQLAEGKPELGFMFSALAGELPDGNVSLTPAFEPDVVAFTANVSQPLLTIRARAAAKVEMSVSGTAAQRQRIEHRQPIQYRRCQQSGRVY